MSIPIKIFKASKIVSLGIDTQGSCIYMQIKRPSTYEHQKAEYFETEERVYYRLSLNSELEKPNILRPKKLQILLWIWLGTQISAPQNQFPLRLLTSEDETNSTENVKRRFLQEK